MQNFDCYLGFGEKHQFFAENCPKWQKIMIITSTPDLPLANFLLKTIVHRVQHRIQKTDTPMRKAIPARVRLQVTLRYLAGASSFSVLV
jgi:hypothetical protein